MDGRRKGGLEINADLSAGCAFSSGGLAFLNSNGQAQLTFKRVGNLSPPAPPDTNGSEILKRLNFADRQAEFAEDAAA